MFSAKNSTFSKKESATSCHTATSAVKLLLPGRLPRHRVSDGAKKVGRLYELFQYVRLDRERKAIVKHFVKKLHE